MALPLLLCLEEEKPTQRAFEINEEMAATVAVIKVTVDKFTAKRRRA